MSNPIRRLVQLILDKAAAQRMQDDAKKALGGVEGAIDRLRSGFNRLAGTIAAVFGARALIAFGESAVKAAADAEKGWTSLKGTIEATGTSFGPLEGRIRATASAFQDATIHEDDEFVSGLQRLVALSGDVGASLQNMGLVANVAARFFDGQLDPAVELVGKTMNGNLTLLERMGLHAKTAQEALQLLAARGFNAATTEAQTFDGQLRQVSNAWTEFKEQLGNAVVQSGEAVGALGVVKAAIVTLTQAVVDNRSEISGGFTDAMVGTVEVLDGVYRGVKGVAELLGGVLFLAIGTLLSPLALLDEGLALLAEGGARVSKALGLEGAAQALGDFRDRLKALAEGLKAPTAVGLEMLGEGAKQFTQRTQLAEDLIAGIRHPSTARPKPPAFLNAPPQVGKNAQTEDQKKIEEALKAFTNTMRSAEAQAVLLGARFDFLGAKTSALQAVIKALGEAGVAPTDARMQKFAGDLLAIQEQSSALEFSKGLRLVRDQASVLGRDFDAAGAEAAVFQKRITDLLEMGVSPTDEGLRALGERVHLLNLQATRDNAFKDYEDGLRAIGVESAVTAGRMDEFGNKLEPNALALNSLTAEAQLLEQTLLSLTPDDPRWDVLMLQLEGVRASMVRVQEQSKVMGEAAALAGQVVGAALAGGIAPFAKAKARENLISAAEETVRGLAAALSLFGAVNAAKHFALAAKYTGIAAAWGALANVSGGGGGGSGGAGAGSAAAGAGASAAAKAQAAPPEIKIYLTGPGWSALNPQIQKVVYGAMQQARERYGDNANVRLQLGKA